MPSASCLVVSITNARCRIGTAQMNTTCFIACNGASMAPERGSRQGRQTEQGKVGRDRERGKKIH